jgi:hypothetical protein
MSARVAFLSRALTQEERHPLPALPPAALTRRNGRAVAFVLEDGKVHEVPITTGRRIGDLVTVSGLASGRNVVLHPDDRLADGQAVELAKRS